MSYKTFGGILASGLTVLVVGGDLLSTKLVLLLTLCSAISLFGMWYQYDKHIQQKAQHEMNMRVRGWRR